MIADIPNSHNTALIFDMDGTLLDTIPDIARSFNTVFKRNGFPGYDPDDYKAFVGSGLRNALISALPDDAGISGDTLQRLLMEIMEEYGKNPAGLTKPYDGIVDLLQDMAGLDVKMAVLSNKAHALTLPIIKTFFSEIPFVEIVGKSDRFPLKPSPESAQYIMEQIKCNPHETLMIGDSVVDFRTAKQAGMIPVSVSWGFNPVEKLLGAGCLTLMHSTEELRQYIQSCLDKSGT
ncbi:MAG: HAD family hydrolase [Bacteroidetes bacterium]|nr:HAD family hydrolase [Bacteroidota bacterium]